MTPCVGQPARLVEHVAGPAAHERAAEAGDRAEGAAPVAAAGQLERGHRAAVEPAAYGRGRWPAPGPISSAPWPGTLERRRRRGRPGRSAAAGAGPAGCAAWCASPRHDRAQPGGDVGVVVEAEHRVGLGQRLGQVLAVPLGQAADRDHGLRSCPCSLRSAASSRVSTESFLAASTKPQVLTSTVSASAGVVDQPEAAGLEPPGQLLGVDLVAGAAEGHHGDRRQSGSRVSGRCAESSVVIGDRVCRGRGRRAEAAGRGSRSGAGRTSAQRRRRCPAPAGPVSPSGPRSCAVDDELARAPSEDSTRDGRRRPAATWCSPKARSPVKTIRAVAVADDDVGAAAGGADERHRRPGRRAGPAGAARRSR